MRSERKKQIMTLSILLVSVLVISVGFAAFSATLKIKPNAMVNPDASDFKVVFSSSANTLETNSVPASPENMGEPATIDNTTVPTISGIEAKTKFPGDTVTYIFYVRNEGGYEAFLNSITFRGKSCIPEEGTSLTMVDSACNSITTTVSVGSVTTTETKTNITGESLMPGESKQVTVTLSYDSNGAYVDGPFTVVFGDISMYYATVNDKNEEVEKICMLTNDVNSNKQVDLADEITCVGEVFYVLPNDSSAHPSATGDNITLVTKYNLNVGNDASTGIKGVQNAEALGMRYDLGENNNYNSCNFTASDYTDYMNTYGNTPPTRADFYKLGNGCNGSILFSETNYWGDVSEGAFIYNNQSLLYPHVENYKGYMKNLGVDVKEASLVSLTQLGQVVTLMQTQGLYLNLNPTSFWIGSAAGAVYVYYVRSNLDYGSAYPQYDGLYYGVRPIIVIPLSDIGV